MKPFPKTSIALILLALLPLLTVRAQQKKDQSSPNIIEEELYDHRYDPYEWFNLSGDPGYDEIKNGLQNSLTKLVGIQ